MALDQKQPERVHLENHQINFYSSFFFSCCKLIIDKNASRMPVMGGRVLINNSKKKIEIDVKIYEMKKKTQSKSME